MTGYVPRAKLRSDVLHLLQRGVCIYSEPLATHDSVLTQSLMLELEPPINAGSAHPAICIWTLQAGN